MEEKQQQPKGVRFEPSEEELIEFLRKKANGKPLKSDFLKECDIYGDKEPWLIFDKFSKHYNYVFSPLKKKSRSRIQRTAGSGTWVLQKTCKVEDSKGKHIGFERLLIFEVGKKGSGLSAKDKTNGRWILHEFSLLEDQDLQYVVSRIRNRKPQPQQPPQEKKSTDVQQQQQQQPVIAPARLQPPLVRVTDFKDLGLDKYFIQRRQEDQETEPQQPTKRWTSPAEQPQLAADYTDLWLSSTCQLQQQEIAPPLIQRPWSFVVNYASAQEPQPIADNMDCSSCNCNICQTQKAEAEQQLSMLQTSDIAPPRQPQPAADYMDLGLQSTWQLLEQETDPQLQRPWNFGAVPAEEPQPVANYMDLWVANLLQTQGEAQPQPNMFPTCNIAPPEQPLPAETEPQPKNMFPTSNIAPAEQKQPSADYVNSGLQSTFQLAQEKENSTELQRPRTCGVVPAEESQPVGDQMDFWLSDMPAASSLFLNESIGID